MVVLAAQKGNTLGFCKVWPALPSCHVQGPWEEVEWLVLRNVRNADVLGLLYRPSHELAMASL